MVWLPKFTAELQGKHWMKVVHGTQIKFQKYTTKQELQSSFITHTLPKQTSSTQRIVEKSNESAMPKRTPWTDWKLKAKQQEATKIKERIS